jgi:hypothetical protein
MGLDDMFFQLMFSFADESAVALQRYGLWVTDYVSDKNLAGADFKPPGRIHGEGTIGRAR